MPSSMAARLQEARAALEVADAEVRTLETEIERSTVRAPIAGGETPRREFALAGHNAAPLIVLGAVHPAPAGRRNEHEPARLLPPARSSRIDCARRQAVAGATTPPGRR